MGPDLARRWLAALLLVPREQRLALVEQVERSIVEVYGELPAPRGASARASAGDGPMPGSEDEPEQAELHVTDQPVQRAGYVEQVTRTYVASEGAREGKAGRSGLVRRASGTAG